MKNYLLALLIITTLIITSISFSDSSNNSNTTDQNKITFPLVNWTSRSNDDEVVIQNGNGLSLVVEISVVGSGSDNEPGVNIKNCGITKHITSGSSAICANQDPSNPVSFSSDTQDQVSGSYQVEVMQVQK